MTMRHSIGAALMMAAAFHASARAQDATAFVGSYCLVGVREVGSCLKLLADGKFQYFLAYGAYDETSEGTWSLGRVRSSSTACPMTDDLLSPSSGRSRATRAVSMSSSKMRAAVVSPTSMSA